MRIGLVIADFEANFTTSFKHTASVKYNVTFETSSVRSVTENLQRLKENIEAGNVNSVHVGYDFTLQDVEHIQHLLDIIVSKYKEHFTSLPPSKKIYTILQQIREAETPTTTQLAKEILNEILTPPQPQKLSKKQQLQADAEAKSKQRAIDYIKKSAKKGK